MSSSIISFPNINKFINFRGKYLLPNIDNNDECFFILTNTTDKYLLTNNDINNKKVEIEVFAVGGGGAGGYYNGSGGDGGTVIYKKIDVNAEEILELRVGEGGYYVRDNRYIKGFQFNLYEGGINDFFSGKNNYLMNSKTEDYTSAGLKKKIERTISRINNLKPLIDNDINSFIINNPVGGTPENSETTATQQWFNFGKGYTMIINSFLIPPYDCSIEITLEAYRYGILFFYSDTDINKNLFKKDLSFYNSNPDYNQYWSKVENGTTTFTRENLKRNERYYFKVIHTQDSNISINPNSININIKLINDKTKREEFIIDDSYFKFNNSIDNFGTVYSTPTTIFNPTVNEFIINASGGNNGTINSLNKNFGNGGCNTYDINNKRIKVCKDDGNGSTGISIPNSISNGLQDLSYRYYKYGSGGGGSIWKEGSNGGKGGTDAGNGISFTNIPSLSSPTPNSGGGGGGNSLLTNITERMLKINKLGGANGILIIKINKKTEQTLIQTFANMEETDEIVKVSEKLELLYKTNTINIYDPEKFRESIKYSLIQLNNYGLTTAGLFIFFSVLMNNIKPYLDLTEKEKLKYPIKFIFNPEKGSFFVENNYYVFNFSNYNEVDFYFSILRPSIEVKGEITRIFNNYYTNNEIVYNPSISSTINLTLKDDNYSTVYFRKIINDLINPSNLILFIENVNKNFFNNFKYLLNFIFFTILYMLILPSNPNNDIIISKINELTQIIKNFNNIYFTPLDKNSNLETDTLVKDRTLYVQKQLEYKKIYDINLDRMEKSNRNTNYSINIFKAKYYQNKKNSWFDTIFYISIIIVIISFLITYNYFEDSNKPLILLVLFIVMLILLVLIWNKSVNDLKIFERFGCKDNITTSVNNCLDLKGLLISDNTVLPYYYISSPTSFFDFKPKNDITADIFVYGTPYNVKIDGIDRYYEPNVDVYKNISLSNTYTYKLYNNRIVASSTDNPDTILIQERTRSNETTRNEIRIYNCGGKRSDLCLMNFETYPLTNKYTRYNSKGEVLVETNKQPSVEDSSFRNHFDFIPDNKNPYYKYGIPYISDNVIREPFIIIKITNDMGASTETLEETIHNFRKELSIFEINVNLHLLNKNTKKIIDFTSKYHIDNQREFQQEIDRNSYIYDRNIQAYNIISREIIINFYIKLLICIIIIIILLCVFIYHYHKNEYPKILVLGLLLSGGAMYLVLYNIFRHQRLDTYKYYFEEPEKKEIAKLR